MPPPPYNPMDFTNITSSLILLLFFFVTACVTATSQLGYLFIFLNNVVSILPILFLVYLLFFSNKTNGFNEELSFKIYVLSAICAICWLFELITSIIYMVIFIKMRFLKFSTLQRKNIFRNTRIFIAEWIFYIFACGVLFFFINQGKNTFEFDSQNWAYIPNQIKTNKPITIDGLIIGFLFGIVALILASIRMFLTVELLDNVKRTTLRHEPVGTCTNDSSIPTS